MTYACPFQAPHSARLCQSRFEHAADLRSHARVVHHASHGAPRLWPEFSLEQLQRLAWFRWSRLQGWAFAMEETTSDEVVA